MSIRKAALAIFDNLEEMVASRVSPKLGARLDDFQPKYRVSFTGPLNGQVQRQRLVRELFRAVDFDEVLETGTNRGRTTEFFAHLFGGPIFTVEINPRYYYYARRRLVSYPNVALTLGDSRMMLRERTRHWTGPPKRIFAYLDAHYTLDAHRPWEEQDIPLHEELLLIAQRCESAVVLIDNFEVWDDPGYYSSALRWDYLPWSAMDGWRAYFPSAPSTEETGSKSGSILLLGPGLSADVAAQLPLRAAVAPGRGEPSASTATSRSTTSS